MQAQIDYSDYQAQATGTRRRLERQVSHVRRLKAAIRAISSAWPYQRGLVPAINAAEALVAEIEGEVTP